ncbi:hypothetical protein OIDMADRAFT_58243 [Oidiodendron maius Zn]|uniref:Uncharacterized protein n=1 Tax=Oidiodendron maius (strain Zn) TaxID=913774 RepID=A0A0C3CCN0_OIDMZ|nr:hypothetical protein OIDMADRAFT_58243 [Oidiodendron maius Zn]
MAIKGSQRGVGDAITDSTKRSISGSRRTSPVSDVLDPNDPFGNYPFEPLSNIQCLSTPKDIPTETRPVPDFQPITADLTKDSCACNPNSLYILSVLHQATQHQSNVYLDRSLAMARKSILLLLCLAAKKLLSRHILLSPKLAHHGQEYAVARVNIEAGTVTISELEVNEGLQGRIIDAIIRTEIQAGIRVFIAFEQVLMNEVNGIDQNVGTALRQLSLALIEQFKEWHP